MARGQCKRVWDQLTDLSHDPTSHWSFVVLMGTQVLVQTGSFPSLLWFFPVSSQLSALCTVDATLSWVFIHVSDLYSLCTSSGLPIFYYYFYVYPLYICFVQSMEWTTFHCRLYSVYKCIYVTIKNLQSESHPFK